MERFGYMYVYNVLKDKIIKGEYPIDSLLPPEPVLEKMFRVSRTTVRKAVEILTTEGMVKKQQGIGTVVLNYNVTQNLNHLTSLTETLTKKGYNVTIPEMSIEIIAADHELSAIFNIPEKSKIAKIVRLTAVDSTPICIMENYIPYKYVEGIEELEGQFVSLYRLLEDKYFIFIEMAQDRIFAKNADAEEAEKLAIPEGFALIGVRRKCMSYGKNICYDIVRLRHDMYSYEVSMYGKR